ncbi:universal stress protein [Pseudorhodobacter sp. W20_MBD10_FR17]|uniref:universal stress protein n=1 Tax=Pseudorhodobacter sp. W20_MBD10_FR17 TaxID=3240266 RepID=UPI003F9D9C38
MIEQLLLATDFTSRSELALDRALVLASGQADKIGALHVIDDTVSTALLRGEESAAPPILAELFDARLEPDAPRPKILIRKGDPFEEILAAADDRGDDLIIMGAPRRRRFLESLRGTTLERVLRASSRPVLSVRGPAKTHYRRVLFATDLSEASGFALQTAGCLGLLDGIHITAVHALWPPVPHMVADRRIPSDLAQKQMAAEKAEAKREMEGFLSGLTLGPLRIDSRVIEGTPHMAIRDCIPDFSPDLVVLGTRGRSGILRLMLGSVAEDLLSWLPVDVLAVPPEDTARPQNAKHHPRKP